MPHHTYLRIVSTIGIVFFLSAALLYLFHTKPMMQDEGALETITAHTATTSLPTVFTKETLMQYNGADKNLPILIAFDGNVYDVSAGRNYYEPGAVYSFLSGTDGTGTLRYIGGDIIKKKYKVIGTYAQ
jgi:predicted heme/steroid binding protein